MIYCMSDIHGDYDRYVKMLHTIHFSDADTLYVIGDAIDRGAQGVEIVLDIMSRNNVVFLRGNHEQMCIDDLYWRKWDARELWQKNGGSATRRHLLYKCSADTRTKILDFFRNAPISVDIEVSARKFHLVHGFPSEDFHEQLWGRPFPQSVSPMQAATAIVGHTPAGLLTNAENMPFCIWHGNGIIDIDCGCGNHLEFGRLACIRLNDMKEFYV